MEQKLILKKFLELEKNKVHDGFKSSITFFHLIKHASIDMSVIMNALNIAHRFPVLRFSESHWNNMPISVIEWISKI
jgi:hypothetical protein